MPVEINRITVIGVPLEPKLVTDGNPLLVSVPITHHALRHSGRLVQHRHG